MNTIWEGLLLGYENYLNMTASKQSLNFNNLFLTFKESCLFFWFMLLKILKLCACKTKDVDKIQTNLAFFLHRHFKKRPDQSKHYILSSTLLKPQCL